MLELKVCFVLNEALDEWPKTGFYRGSKVLSRLYFEYIASKTLYSSQNPNFYSLQPSQIIQLIHLKLPKSTLIPKSTSLSIPNSISFHFTSCDKNTVRSDSIHSCLYIFFKHSVSLLLTLLNVMWPRVESPSWNFVCVCVSLFGQRKWFRTCCINEQPPGIIISFTAQLAMMTKEEKI